VTVQERDTSDPAEDGVVLSQTPRGGKQADVGSTVNIVVGVLITPTTDTTPTTPTTTETTTTITP
jgi:beta-lactam-binding protein with PASTA domain